MSRSSGERNGARDAAVPARQHNGARAQVEPLAALVAVAAVCAGLGLYAGVLDSTLSDDADRTTVSTVATAALDAVAPAGVAIPDRLGATLDAAPDGYRLNVTLLSGSRRWTVGPEPPARSRTADRSTGVRLAPGAVRPGTLRVVLWR